MVFSVDKRLKRKIQIATRKQVHGIYYLWLFEKISFALVIAYAILFPIYCIVTGYLVSTNMRTGKLSYFLVASETTIYALMGLTAVLFIYVLRARLECLFIGDCVNEEIQIDGDKLVYAFRIKYQTPEHERHIVVIDLSRVSNLSYNDKLSEISIDGMMLVRTIKASTSVSTLGTSKMADSNITINDYFIPSLYEVLKSKIAIGDTHE